MSTTSSYSYRGDPVPDGLASLGKVGGYALTLGVSHTVTRCPVGRGQGLGIVVWISQLLLPLIALLKSLRKLCDN